MILGNRDHARGMIAIAHDRNRQQLWPAFPTPLLYTRPAGREFSHCIAIVAITIKVILIIRAPAWNRGGGGLFDKRRFMHLLYYFFILTHNYYE